MKFLEIQTLRNLEINYHFFVKFTNWKFIE